MSFPFDIYLYLASDVAAGNEIGTAVMNRFASGAATIRQRLFFVSARRTYKFFIMAISPQELARRIKEQGKEIIKDNQRADYARMSKEERKIYNKKQK